MEKGLLIELLLKIFIDFFGCAEIFLFLTHILLLKWEKRLYRWIIAVFFVAVINILLIIFNNDFLIFLQLIGLASSVMLCVTGKLKHKIVRFIFAMLSMYSLRGIVLAVYRIILPLVMNHKYINDSIMELIATLQGEMVIIVLILCVGGAVKKVNGYSRWIISINNSVYMIMSFCMFLMVIMSEYIEYINAKENIANISIIFQLIAQTAMYSFCIGLARIDYKRQCYERECILKEQYLLASREYFEKLKWQIDEIRRMKHDMNSHYTALDLLLQNNDVLAAKDYLNIIREHQLKAYSAYFTVGNELVDAVIYAIVNQFNGISIHVDGFVGDTDIQDYDLCTIFSNLIQNAAESVDKLKDNKEINIEIRHYQSRLLISVSNHFGHKINIDNLGKYTTKENSNNHGYGISNVIRTVEKYNGDIRFEINDNVFFANLCLNFTELQI